MFRSIVAAAVFATPAFAREAQPVGSIPEACEAYAKVVLASLPGEPSISIGRVRTVEQFGLATGRGVEMELRTALEKEKKGVVAPKAKYEIRGIVEYLTSDNKVRYAGLAFRVFEVATNKELVAAARGYATSDIEDVARLFGPTVRMAAGKTLPERGELMGKALDAPGGAVIRGALVAAGDSSPYTFGLIVTTDGARDNRAITLDEGRPVAKLRKTDTFELYLENRSETDIGAQLFLDGIDTYSFAQKRADGKPFASAYRVPARVSWRFMGWHLTQFNWEEFRFDKPKTVPLPPAQDTKWSSATIIISTIRPDPKAPGRFITELPLDFITIRMGN